MPVQGCTLLYVLLSSNTHCSLLRLIVRYGLEVPTFATRRLHACHHARAPSGGWWNCGREISGKFCLNDDFHFIFRDLLHAVKLRHGTDGFTSPPKESMLRIRLMCYSVSVFISVLATLLSENPLGISYKYNLLM